MDVYKSDNQAAARASCCGMNEGEKARFDSFRFQRGLFVAANSSGALTLAAGTTVTLFQRGTGGDATGAGFPSGIAFTDADTNVNDENGITNCEILHVGAQIGRPHNASVSGSALTVAETDVLEPYAEGIVRLISDNVSVTAILAANQQKPEYVLGNVSMLPPHRGQNDNTAYGAHGTSGLPLLLAQRIDVPPSSGNSRTFAIRLRVERTITFAARSTPAVGSIYIPVTVSLEVAPRGAD